MFQCLLIGGENIGEDALKNAEEFVVSDEEFESFILRHKTVKCLVPESNDKVRATCLGAGMTTTSYFTILFCFADA